MKLIPPLLCALTLAAMPMASRAESQSEALRIGLGVGLLMGQSDDDRRRHRDEPPPQNGRRDDRRDERRDVPPPPPGGGAYRGYEGGYDRRAAGGGGEVRDERINRAISIGQGRGRVLNAWPQGGSLFVVRVDTPRGRVDMIIDVDTGRVVGER